MRRARDLCSCRPWGDESETWLRRLHGPFAGARGGGRRPARAAAARRPPSARPPRASGPADARTSPQQAADDALLGRAHQARHVPRREPLHDLGVQVRAARGGSEGAPKGLGGSRAAARRRRLARVRRPRPERARHGRGGRAAAGPARRGRDGVDRPPARGVRRARAARGPDRRARRAPLRPPAARSTRPCTTRGGRLRAALVRPRPGGLRHDSITLLSRLLGPDGPEVRLRGVLRAPRRVRRGRARRLATPSAPSPGMAAHLDGCPACREDHESLRALVSGEPS